MRKHTLWAALAFSSLMITACAPPGQQSVGFRDIDWPRADQELNPSDRREIEVLLVRLGYMRGGADGNITTTTRQSIRTYQRDIGAPITGFVSVPLLYSLRTNAPQVATARTSTTAPAYKPASTTSTPVSNTTTTSTPRSVTPAVDGAGGSGGSGGSGGGSWN